MKRKWETYEEVSVYLLNQFATEFGLSNVEGKQLVPGNSGTRWEIDAKGFLIDEEGFVIVECRRYNNSKQNQEKLAGLAYRIIDTGASGGIIVSPLGLQAGAELVAKAGNIVSITLDKDSTSEDFLMKFLNKVFIGFSDNLEVSDDFEITIIQTCGKCGNTFNTDGSKQNCPFCDE